MTKWLTLSLSNPERAYTPYQECHRGKNLPGLLTSILSKLEDEFSSVQLVSHVQLFAIPWTTACQASLSITNSKSPPKLMSIESVMPSNHLILCRPLLLLPSIFPSIRVFSNESALCIRWPKCWSFSFNISPSNEHPGQISFRMDWLDLLEWNTENQEMWPHPLFPLQAPSLAARGGVKLYLWIKFGISTIK